MRDLTLHDILAVFFLTATVLTEAGCGGSVTQNNEQGFTAPAIVHEPLNASVPLGLAAQFSVAASGYPLNYQWFKNGVALPSATNAVYTTPPTAPTDTGSLFTATVSNSLGSISTSPASLVVTARSPMSGDLRFQGVDAVSTVNGYDTGPVGYGSSIPGRGAAYFTQSIGTPLYVGPIICAQPQSNAISICDWPYVQINLGYGVDPSLSVGYAGDFFSNFQSDLQTSVFGAGGSAIDAPNSVVTALDLEPADGVFAVSYVQSSVSSGFQLNELSVNQAALQTVVSSEASQGRVVTGVSYNYSQVMLMSYGWQADTTTVYEAEVLTATSATAPSAAAQLAQAGYIITAVGGSNINDNYLLIGTRVKGDTMPRPFLSSTTSVYDLAQYGYAVIGVIENQQGTTTFLGER